MLAVLLVNSRDGKACYQAEKAIRIFAREGIAYTHFYEDYRNDLPYVIQRIGSALG